MWLIVMLLLVMPHVSSYKLGKALQLLTAAAHLLVHALLCLLLDSVSV